MLGVLGVSDNDWLLVYLIVAWVSYACFISYSCLVSDDSSGISWLLGYLLVVCLVVSSVSYEWLLGFY
jgi:uncharacterized membrane protein YtjA (UPF0391 family)